VARTYPVACSGVRQRNFDFGKILNAKKIYAFEPQKEVFNILKRNVELNELTNKVNIYNLALGDSVSKSSDFCIS